MTIPSPNRTTIGASRRLGAVKIFVWAIAQSEQRAEIEKYKILQADSISSGKIQINTNALIIAFNVRSSLEQLKAMTTPERYARVFTLDRSVGLDHEH